MQVCDLQPLFAIGTLGPLTKISNQGLLPCLGLPQFWCLLRVGVGVGGIPFFLSKECGVVFDEALELLHWPSNWCDFFYEYLCSCA
jgi:hypothetical protein